MKNFKIFIAVLISVVSTAAAAQEIRINLEKANPDSVISVARREAGLRLYFPATAYSDSVKVSVNTNASGFLKALSSQLILQGYVAEKIGGSIYVFKESGIIKGLPEATFQTPHRPQQNLYTLFSQVVKVLQLLKTRFIRWENLALWPGRAVRYQWLHKGC